MAKVTAQAVRAAFTNTFISSGNYSTLPDIENALTSGGADLVAMARPFISNPDLVERLRTGATLAVPDQATFYAPGAHGFADGYTGYPRATPAAA